MALIDDLYKELEPAANGGGLVWSRGMGVKYVCWLLYLILLELRKTKTK